MRNNTKKGFTLVELLVVIAILAILATVSVVGYTSFIERANVSADEQLVAQLNNFLAAYKVNNPEKIDEHNVREVTRDILELSGVEELVPKSKNHFYFNLATGKYELVADEKATGASTGMVGGLFAAHAESYEFDAVPGNCFTEGRQYYFVDTEGEIADVINSFYTYSGEGEFDEETFASFVTAAGKVSDKFTELLDDCVFITNGGVYYVEGSTKTNRYFHDNEGLVIDKSLDITLEIDANGVVTPFELPGNVGQIDTGSLKFTNVPDDYTDVVFTVDMPADEFKDVILYDENLTVKFEMSGNVVGTLGTNAEGHYVIKADVDYQLNIAKNKVIHVKSDNITHVGNVNAVKLSDLFELRNGLSSLPGNGWKLVVYAGNDKPLVETGDATGTVLSVDDAEQDITVTNGALTELTLQFKNTDANKIKIAIENSDGEYASVEVYVVNGKNVRDWVELAGSATTAAPSTSTSIVMLNDITMPEILGTVEYYKTSDALQFGSKEKDNLPTAQFTISGGATLYGNHFTFDVTNGLITGPEGIITVTGHLRDVRIVGRIFPEFGARVQQIWGTNVVKANDGSTITNCYIANGRAPIRTSGAVTIEDTVLFGGRYANICATGKGTLTLKGTVVTVNQPHNNPYDNVSSSTVGVGIAVWYDSKMQNTHDPVITVAEGATLTQYNFIRESEAKNLPTVKIGITSANVGEVFASLFDDDKYSDYIFENGADRYISAANINLNNKELNISTMTGHSAAKGKYWGYPAYVYLPEDDDSAANNKLFADSVGATDKYCPWDVEGNPSYDFECVNGMWTIIH